MSFLPSFLLNLLGEVGPSKLSGQSWLYDSVERPPVIVIIFVFGGIVLFVSYNAEEASY